MAPVTKNVVSVLWFRNGLRFHDNPCFQGACEQSIGLIPICIVNSEFPFAQTPHRRAGCIRANFVLESMKELDRKLVEMGTRLLVFTGLAEDILPEIVAKTKATALYYEKETAAPVCEADAAVLQAIQERLRQGGGTQKCRIHGYETHTLHPMDHYLTKCRGHVAPSTYREFTRIFQSMTVPKEVQDVTSVPPLPDECVKHLTSFFKRDLAVPSLEELGYENANVALTNRAKGGIDFVGGEDAGLALLDRMMKRSRWVATFEKPNTSPNALMVDTTGLSPCKFFTVLSPSPPGSSSQFERSVSLDLKHGCLSPRRFFHELSKVYAKFNPKELSQPPVSLHGQLMWREYNYLTGYTTPKFDKMIGNPIARQIPWDNDPVLLDKWTNSQTGYPFIDAIMSQLRETGWIHHLARHAVACFLTRGDLWQSWEKGAEVFEYYLIDADWSINNFNWQWLSCTAHFYQYFRCYSPIAFGKKTDPNGNYIRKWLPIFAAMPAKYIYEPWEAPIALQKKIGVIVGETYPMPVVEHKIVSKENMTRMKEAYDAQRRGDPVPERPPGRTSTDVNGNDCKRQRVDKEGIT